jgi:hypothetical protein
MLIQTYRTRPKRLMLLWPFLSFMALCVVYDFTFPEVMEAEELEGVTLDDFSRMNKLISLPTGCLSFSILYTVVLRNAYSGQLPPPPPPPPVPAGVAQSSSQRQEDGHDTSHHRHRSTAS